MKQELIIEKALLERSKKRLADFERLRAPEAIINNEKNLIKEREAKIKELRKEYEVEEKDKKIQQTSIKNHRLLLMVLQLNNLLEGSMQ